MNKYLVEFLGSILFTFVIFATGNNALAIGIALAMAIQLAGRFSSGAFNPAVTIALMYSGKLSQEDLIPYVTAQIAGALVGFELFRIGMNI